LKRWISSTKSSVPARSRCRARAPRTPLEVGDAGRCGNLLEMQVGRLRQEPRHRGLAGAGGPRNERAEQRVSSMRVSAVGAEQVVLPTTRRAWSGAAGRPADAARRECEPGGGERIGHGRGTFRSCAHGTGKVGVLRGDERTNGAN
jgi:hypothetical protein